MTALRSPRGRDVDLPSATINCCWHETIKFRPSCGQGVTSNEWMHHSAGAYSAPNPARDSRRTGRPEGRHSACVVVATRKERDVLSSSTPGGFVCEPDLRIRT